MKKLVLLAALFATVFSAPCLVRPEHQPTKSTTLADGGSPIPLCNPYTQVCPKLAAPTS